MVDLNIFEHIQPFRVSKCSIKYEVDSVVTFLQIAPGKLMAKKTEVLETTRVHCITKPLPFDAGTSELCQIFLSKIRFC